MPQPNEHVCELHSSAGVDRCARKHVNDKNDIGDYKHTGKPYDLLICWKGDSSEVVSYHYKRDGWDETPAKKHCEAHGGKFIGATGEPKGNEMKTIVCELVGKVLKIQIAGAIGGEGGCSAADVLSQISANPGATSIEVEIASNGGSYMEGLKMYHALKNSGKPVSIKVLGLAASAATLPMCAGTVSMPKDAWLMIHLPSLATEGNAEELKKDAKQLDAISKQMADIYAEKSGGKADHFLKLMADETYLTGDDAKALKLVDDVTAQLKIAATADVLVSAKAPDALKAAVKDAKAACSSGKAVADEAESTEAFHKDAATQWGKRGAGHAADANAAKGEGLASESVHNALALRCEAHRLGHEAMATGEPGKHGMAEAAHRIAATALAKTPICAGLAKHHQIMATYHAAMSGAEALPSIPVGCYGAELKDAEILAVAFKTSAGVVIKGDAQLPDVFTAPIAERTRAIVVKELEAKAKDAADAAKNPRLQFKALVALFGQDAAGRYFGKDMTVEQAKDAYIGEVRAQIGRLEAEKTELASALAQVRLHPAIAFDPTQPGTDGERLTAAEEDNVKELCRHTPQADPKAIRAQIIADKKAKKEREANK